MNTDASNVKDINIHQFIERWFFLKAEMVDMVIVMENDA